MNSKKALLTLAAASILCAGTVMAGEIYRYMDENGQVIYVDRPTGDPTEERLDVVSLNTNNAAVQERVQARREGAIAAAGREADESDQEPTRAEKRAAAAAQEQQCQQYRLRLESYVSSRRLFRTDENGERVYLNDDESQEARDRVQQLINENCN